MFKLYRILFLLLSPFLRAYFYIRCLYGKDKFESVKNHFGHATIKRPEGKLIWVHAASIGESTTALTFIEHVKNQFPDLNVLLTTVTVTSARILAPKIAKIRGCYHQIAVADSPRWIAKFLDYWEVDVAFFLESEIWPNIVDTLYCRGIPIFLLNARLSSRSFNRWSLFRKIFASILKKFTCILAQSEIDAQRYGFFSKNNVKCIDNLKYANALLSYDANLLKIFKKMCRGKKVLVAASTHDGEEETIIEAHKRLISKFDLLTIVIPRHIGRIGDICNLLKK
ncbi:MAG: hypothetical protein LBS23_02615, partial [Holosporaceae bacterium]|nr:hypothetical protein [Holosporaceae bacterium]